MKIKKTTEQKRLDICDIDTITTEQLGYKLQVGKSSAEKKMREIKSISDTMGTSGVCHLQDYELWLNYKAGKTKYNRELS